MKEKMKVILDVIKKSYNKKHIELEEKLEFFLRNVKKSLTKKRKEWTPKIIAFSYDMNIVFKRKMKMLIQNGINLKNVFVLLKNKSKSLILNTWSRIKTMPKNKFYAKMSTVAIMFILMLPITTVKASNVTLQDTADRFSVAEEKTLTDKIDELSKEYDVDVLLITTKEDIKSDDHHAYLSDMLKTTFPKSDSSLGILFDFYKSTYTIVPKGKILLHITEDEINAAYDICDTELKKMDPSIYNCCSTVFETLLQSATETKNEENALNSNVKNANDAFKKNMPSDESLKPVDNLYMRDLADLLTDAEEEKLISWINKTYGKEYNVLFLTTNDTGGKTTMIYSDDYMDQLFPDTDENIAFVIDMANREIYVNTMGSAITKLDDTEIDKALDLGFKKITNSKYYECMQVMSEYCLNELYNKSNFMSEYIANLKVSLLFALIISAIIVAITIAIHNKANKRISAEKYESKESYEIIDKDAVYERSYDTVQRDYYKPKSSSSGGGSSHRSSSGRSHGGGGRGF